MMIAHTADGVWIQLPGSDKPYRHPALPQLMQLLETLTMIASALRLLNRRLEAGQ